MKKVAKWEAYVERLYDAGLGVLAEADKISVGSSTHDPKVLALALLSRTLNNFMGATAMIDAGLIVEARTLTRSCFENLLWQAELVDKREAFIADMIRDEAASQQSKGRLLLFWDDKVERYGACEDNIRQRIAQLGSKFPKAKGIKFSDLGKGNGVADSYMWFKLLSGDAAHPSLTSLGRHLAEEPDGTALLTVTPVPSEREVEQTLQFACQALLGVCVATCEIVEVPKAHAALSPCFDEFMKLAKREQSSAPTRP
jgi:hypothetical protein